jgi:hypothetical protein
MARKKRQPDFVTKSDSGWTKFEHYQIATPPEPARVFMQGSGKHISYVLDESVELDLLESFRTIRDSSSALRFVREFGVPFGALNQPEAAVSVEELTALATSIRFADSLQRILSDESIELSTYIEERTLEPMRGYLFTDTNSLLVTKAKAMVSQSEDLWNVLTRVLREANNKHEKDRMGIEVLAVAEFDKLTGWAKTHIGLGINAVAFDVFGVENFSSISNHKFDLGLHSGYLALAYPRIDWSRDPQTYSSYYLSEVFRQVMNQLLSSVSPCLKWTRDNEKGQWRLEAGFDCDSPWDVMVRTIQKRFTGEAKLSYCKVCRRPFQKRQGSQYCGAPSCRQKAYRMRVREEKLKGGD